MTWPGDHESVAKEALAEGHEAARDGLPRSANPYPEGTREHNDWALGREIEQRLANDRRKREADRLAELLSAG